MKMKHEVAVEKEEYRVKLMDEHAREIKLITKRQEQSIGGAEDRWNCSALLHLGKTDH